VEGGATTGSSLAGSSLAGSSAAGFSTAGSSTTGASTAGASGFAFGLQAPYIRLAIIRIANKTNLFFITVHSFYNIWS